MENHNQYGYGPNQVDDANEWGGVRFPTTHQIAERAHSIWVSRGCPEGTAEDDWMEAERELRAADTSRAALQHVNEDGGSVQH